jgi:hypothetical protein
MPTPEMDDLKEIQESLKKYKLPASGSAKSSAAPSAAPEPSGAAARAPTLDIYDPDSPNFNAKLAAARGAARGVGQLPLDILKGADWLSPSLGTLARQIPGVRSGARTLREFVEQPGQDPSKESWTEYLAKGGSEFLTPIGVMSKLKAARWLEDLAGTGMKKLLTRQATKTVPGGRAWVNVPGQANPVLAGLPPKTITSTVPRFGLTTKGAQKAERITRKVARGLTPTAYGAAAGALENPEHPGEGAAEGAAAATAARGIGALAKRTGHFAESLLPGVVAHNVVHVAGVPWYPFGAAMTHAGPIRRAISKTGGVIRKGGEVISHPTSAAIISGTTSRTLNSDNPWLLDLIRQLWESSRPALAGQFGSPEEERQ